MNFNEEIDKELKLAGISGGKIIKIPKADRGTPEDYAKLEAKIQLKTMENDIMLSKSMEYAKKSILI